MNSPKSSEVPLENDTTQGKRINTRTVGLAAYAFLSSGVLLILLSVLGKETWHWSDVLTAFIRDIGLLFAAVMVGGLIHEKLIRDEMAKATAVDLQKLLKMHVPSTAEIAKETTLQVHRLLSERPPTMTGIRLLSATRRNYPGYYNWVIEVQPQELFFAGRSVLHRIEADLRERKCECIEEILFRKLKEGCNIKILFLDPRIEIIQRLADEEGQSVESMLSDIRTSIAVSKRLADVLEKRKNELPKTAELYIRIYDRIPYFAYHQQDKCIMVGFYFAKAIGYESGIYEVVDDTTRKVFSDHFVHIMQESQQASLLEFTRSRSIVKFNANLFSRLSDFLINRLDTGSHDKTPMR